MRKECSVCMKRILLAALVLLLVVPVVPALGAGQGFQQASLEGTILVARNDSPQVELFVTSWCPYCKDAIRFFRSRGIPYKVYDIEKDVDAARRKMKLDPSPGVPFALINGYKVHGYSKEAYLQALGRD